MGLFSRNKPKIKIQSSKKDGYSGWIKCCECNDMVHANEVEKNDFCCPKCDYHYRVSATQRIQQLVDPDTFQELFTQFQATDPLNFVDTEAYTQRLEEAKKKSHRDEAVIVGKGKMQGKEVALAVMDFSFMAGSMGSVVGERLTCLIEKAVEESLPLIIVSASGGARMQESILSLMQMAKTSAALAQLNKAGLPYISVVTNPTTGGVTASFASLGDVILAEPGALVAFAGPRVVEQVINQKLPPGAQKSAFLLERGMIDCIVNRHKLKEKICDFLFFFSDNERKKSSLLGGRWNCKKEPSAKILKDLLSLSKKQKENGEMHKRKIYGK